MSKQIVVTQHDSGISLLFNITEDNKPYNLLNKKCECMIVFPDDTKKQYELSIIDGTNGKVELLLTKELTELPGIHKMYISVEDSSDRVTVQRLIVYFVLEEYGGVS